jgi:hypothetical protein
MRSEEAGNINRLRGRATVGLVQIPPDFEDINETTQNDLL